MLSYGWQRKNIQINLVAEIRYVKHKAQGPDSAQKGLQSNPMDGFRKRVRRVEILDL